MIQPASGAHSNTTALPMSAGVPIRPIGPSFTIAASKDGVVTLLRTLAARGATAAQTLIGLEASGHLWENLEAALVGAGYRVLVLNPLQTRR